MKTNNSITSLGGLVPPWSHNNIRRAALVGGALASLVLSGCSTILGYEEGSLVAGTTGNGAPSAGTTSGGTDGHSSEFGGRAGEGGTSQGQDGATTSGGGNDTGGVGGVGGAEPSAGAGTSSSVGAEGTAGESGVGGRMGASGSSGLSICGDGIVDSALGEDCDGGDPKNPGPTDSATCTAKCKTSTCGDGYVNHQANPAEDCEPAAVGGPPCNAQCRLTFCGDGIVDQSIGEQCDPGKGITESATCTRLCLPSYCGDWYINRAASEECDDGNVASGDGCTEGCRHVEYGWQCPNPAANGKGCTRLCGNGRIDGPLEQWGSGAKAEIYQEQCDDGNLVSGDGCNAQCARESGWSCDTPGSECRLCGNGKIELGEQCDGGALDGAGNPMPKSTATCDADCTVPGCGDNFINSALGEICDSSNGANSSTCNGNAAPSTLACQLTACGDNYVNMAAGESCDNSSGVDTATCNGKTAPSGVACREVTCGDGYVNAAAEWCDDGTGTDTSTCNGKTAPGGVACHWPMCGDNYVNSTVEECEGSSGADTKECNGTSAGASLQCKKPACGDGYANAAAEEQCDPGAVSLAGCSGCRASPGFTCARDATGGSVCSPICGDGMVADGEACDDGNTAACGTCNATCSMTQVPASAVGSFDIHASSEFQDGDYVTLSDGVSELTFRFVEGIMRSDDPSVRELMIFRGDSPPQTAEYLAIVINRQSFGVQATYGSTSTVRLANQNKGAKGNVPILWSSAFHHVSGMSGGVAYDCPAGTGCSQDADCLSGSCCLQAGTPTSCTSTNLRQCL